MAIHSDAHEGMETLAGSLSGLIPKSLSCWIILYWRRMKFGGFREEVISMNIKNPEAVTPSASAFKRWRPKGIMDLAAEPSRAFMFVRPRENLSPRSTLCRGTLLPTLSNKQSLSGKKNCQTLLQNPWQNQPRPTAGNGAIQKVDWY